MSCSSSSQSPTSLPSPPLTAPTPMDSSAVMTLDDELPTYSDTLRSGPAKYACLMLSGSDRIQAISFPYNRRMRDLLVSALKVGEGVANCDLPEDGVWDFKLYGTPWSMNALDAVRAPHILVSVYMTLAPAGWHPSASVDIAKKKTSHDSIYFRTGPRIHREFFAVTIEDSDKLRLVDAPSARVRDSFVAACATWHRSQTVQEKELGSLLVKFGGTPWTAWKGDHTRGARRVLAAAMEQFEIAGFELVSSVSLSGRVMMIFGTRRF